MRVLVIDDDDIARELVAGTLEQLGYQVFELPTAIGATRMIFQRAIEAVVIDVMLPDMNGDKLARLLRENPRGRKLAIVLISSRPVDELQRLATAADADAVVPKTDIRTRLGLTLRAAHQSRTGAAPR
ncbi:MAG: response regulator [Polyangiaceae bacterium]|nr:response regulator [Polyangiaceae bacterium]